MDLNKLISNLSYLGVDDTSALVYVELLRAGPLPVGSLAKRLEIDRGKIYRSVNDLANKGIVSTKFGNPVICQAEEPQKAVDKLIERKQEEIITMQKISNQIVAELENVHRRVDEDYTPAFSLVQGRSNIFSNVSELISNAKNAVFVVGTLRDVVLMYHTSIPEKIKIGKKNGAKIMLLIDEINPTLLPTIKEFNFTEIRVGQLPTQSRIVVEKDTLLIMSTLTRSDQKLDSASDVVLRTNSKELVNNIFSFCNHLWDNAKPITKGKSVTQKQKIESGMHSTKELEQEKIILQELTKILSEEVQNSTKVSSKQKLHIIKELEQEKIIKDEIQKLLAETKKLRKKK